MNKAMKAMEMAESAAESVADKGMDLAGKAADRAMGKADDVMVKLFAPDRVAMNLGGSVLSADDKYILNPFGKDPFGADPPGCMDVFCLICGCVPRNALYFTLGGKMMNIHQPGICCCRKPWQVTTWKRGNDVQENVSKALPDRPKCCSSANGFAFSKCGAMCCLPMCQTSGHKKHLRITDESSRNEKGEAREKYTILQELVFCWVVGYGCAGVCTPCGQTWASTKACMEFCSGRFIREIVQPVYGPLESRNSPPEKVGEVKTTHLMCPISICCAMPCQTVRTTFQTKDKKSMDEKDLASASLLLAMYKEQSSALDMFLSCRPKFPQPMGVPCTDMGLHAQVRYVSVMDALKDGIFDL